MIQFFIYMNLIGSIFFLFSNLLIKVMYNRLLPKQKVFLCKINILMFLLPLPLLSNLYKRVIFFYSFSSESLIVLSRKTYIQITEDSIQIHWKNVTLFILICIIFCSTILLVKTIINLICYTKFIKILKHQKRFKLDTKVIQPLLKESKIKRKIQMYKSQGSTEPFTFGFFKLQIYLPSQFSLKDDINYLILKHELAHIKHHDNLFKFMLLILVIIYWYNPIIYMLNSNYNNTSELAADYYVLSHCSTVQKKQYMNAVIDYSLNTKEIFKRHTCSFVSNEKKIIKERIYFMKNSNKTKRLFKLFPLCCFIFIFFSTLPVLAYEAPSIIYSDREWSSNSNECDFFSSSTIDKKTLFSDFYFTDETGTKYNIDTESRILCIHSFVNGTVTRHIKSSNGSCIVKQYQAKRCKYCGDCIVGTLLSTTTYPKCPH